ncbi:MAG: aminotransferase class I/II-fold pyridoxal phosphate-dependent enzyme [Acidimicrobiales bacterium]|nr:aminotransferase class I/II-fold pyridoxal phosphate-dependent enzyme [Acidimicrobiales bacterium]
MTINLFSDTQTRPTDAMRAAMASAEVGDEQRKADPTVNELQERMADLLGKERAIFFPTGTMCNLVAIAAHTTHGDSIVLEHSGHVLRSETSGAAAVSGCVIETIRGERGMFTVEQLNEVMTPGNQYAPPTRLVCLEQTHNFAGGTVWPLDRYSTVADAAHDAGVVVHTDGARLMNAVVASGASAEAWAAPVDTIWVDFTKGLGAPTGAVLAGDDEVMERAWLLKHRFGGAMRQAGIVAAGCLHALDHHVDRLADDHANARRLADGLAELGFTVTPPDTNLVYVDPRPVGLTAKGFATAMASHNIEISTIGDRNRLCTHLDVSTADVDAALDAVRAVLAEGPTDGLTAAPPAYDG